MPKSNDPPSIFAERLRRARDARGLSQSDVAKRSGLEPSAVSHFETGRRSPSFDNLKRLADALRVSTDYLLGRIESMTGTDHEAHKLFRHYEDMTVADQEFLEKMAEDLSRRSKRLSSREE